MYFAIDKDGDFITCYVAEEIIIDDSIKYHSDNEDDVKNFCLENKFKKGAERK